MKEEETKKKAERNRLHGWIRLAINLAGTVIALYVGGWMMFAHSIFGTYAAFHAGTLTVPFFTVSLIKCMLSATVAGGIWCAGYILGNHWDDQRRD